MKKRFCDLFAGVLELPPTFYYVGLGVICVALFALSWLRSGFESNAAVPTIGKIRSFDAQPQQASELVDLAGKLTEEAGRDYKIGKSLKAAIDQLENRIVAAVSGQRSVGPGQVSSEFTATGIDRASFLSKFDDGQIAVQRWQASDTKPNFDGTESFERLVANVLKPWIGSAEFRIEMKVYSRNPVKDILDAKLVVESTGRTSENQATQATSIWNTTWRIDGQELTLESVQIVAQEEITANFSDGQLLLDCTESILKHCGTLENQLIYGLDQWSRCIPNIDIMGNQGIAVGDINRDGLDDLYICQPHGLPNCLLLQNPDATVRDVSRLSKSNILDQSHAALIIDIDNDGDQDLVISTDENLVLMSNTGKGEFQLENTLSIGRNADSISAADYDQDGDLDLFLCKPQDINRQSDLLMFPRHIDSADDGGRNVLLRNDEGWSFRDVTEECGIVTRNTFCSRSAIWQDFDYDGDLDLYVTNEFMTDQFFENENGWFSEFSHKAGLTVPARHRSVSVGEFNQDGRLDFFVATDVPFASLQELRRTKKSTESENPNTKDSNSRAADMLLGESQLWLTGAVEGKLSPFFLRAPIFSNESAFSSATADLNNDGLDDVVVTNGLLTRFKTEDVDELFYADVFPGPAIIELNLLFSHNSSAVRDSHNQELSVRIARRAHEVADLIREGYSFGGNQRNRCYLGIGQFGFANFSALSGVDLPDDARAVATTDWDCDGDADIVMTCRGGPQVRILCNQLDSKNGFVQFDLVGTESNADAIGARVEVYLKGRTTPLVKSLLAGSGRLSQSTKRVMFGLGETPTIERVDVVWPSGKTQSFDGIVPDARYEIVEGESQVAEKTNDRFQLAIMPGALEGNQSLPEVNGNSIFYPRPPVPQLQYQTEPGKWYTLQPQDQRPLLAVFWKRNSASDELIQSISNASSRLIEKNVDCVAVLVDSETGDSTQQLEYAKQVMERCKFSFPSGTASASTRDKLRYLAGDWFSHQQVPNLPFAVLLDGQGRACGFYSKEKLAINDILFDLQLVGQPDWMYRDMAAPRGGRWTARYRFAKLNRLRSRLKEVGYQSDADMLYAKSKAQRAYELCQKAIELDSQGDSTEARAYFVKSIEMDSACVAAYIGEGNLLRRLANQQAGISPDVRVKMQLAAAANFNHAIELDPTNTEAIIGQAYISIDQNRLSEALDQLEEYIRVDPTRYEIHAIIGRLFFHQEKYKEATEFLATAFDNRPTLPYVAGDLGFLYLKTGDYERAQKFLSLAHRSQPSDVNILRLLAEAEFVSGRFDVAIKLFEQVTQRDPNRRRSQNVLAWLLATCPFEKHRDGEKAMNIIAPMIELFGEGSPSTLEIYAACFAENKQFDKAVHFQQLALDLINDNDVVGNYTEEQKLGLKSRLQLYRRQRPYRMADISRIPIKPPANKRINFVSAPRSLVRVKNQEEAN